MRGFSLLVAVWLTGSASASFYDLAMSLDRTKGLPPIDAILAGKFEQHSDAYYDRVIAEQRERSNVSFVPKKPVILPNATRLAPALARRGDLNAALAALDPQRNGAADTAIEHSTRGTILLARGDFDDAVAELEAAVRRNPRNPFSRDDYELKLARYLRNVQRDPSLPEREPTYVRSLLRDESPSADAAPSARATITQEAESARERKSREVEKALTALTALIRFSDLNAAHHYAAMGDLLRYKGELPRALRAYRRALENRHPWPAVIEKQLAELRMPSGEDLRLVDAAIESERRSADDWVRAYRAREAELLRSGTSFNEPDDFESFYSRHGNLRDAPVRLADQAKRIAARYWPAISVVTLLLAVLAAKLASRLRWKSAPTLIAAD